MSAVIKLGSAQDAKGIMAYAPDRPAPAEVAPRPDPREVELAKLRRLLAERDAALAEVDSAIAEARAQGEKAGRRAAELAAEDRRERALELLREGIARANETLAENRESMEVLALLIARTAIEKLFGGDRVRKEAVSALALHQVRAIDRQMLLRIEVSPLDFPEPQELGALAAELGVDAEQVAANAELAAGGCRMRLRIGTVEIGADQQWGAMRGLLDALAGAAGTKP